MERTQKSTFDTSFRMFETVGMDVVLVWRQPWNTSWTVFWLKEATNKFSSQRLWKRPGGQGECYPHSIWWATCMNGMTPICAWSPFAGPGKSRNACEECTEAEEQRCCRCFLVDLSEAWWYKSFLFQEINVEIHQIQQTFLRHALQLFSNCCSQ